MKPDKKKFKRFLTDFVVLKAEIKGTTPIQELNLLRLEALNRKLKEKGLLKDETSDQNQEVNKETTE